MYDDFPTRREVRRGFFAWLPTVFLILVVLLVIGGGITWAGHKFGWWLAGQDAARQAQVIQNGYSNQTTLRSQVTEKLSEVASLTTQAAEAGNDPAEVSALKDQRAAIAGIVCADAAQITATPLPAQQAQWVSANCSAGTLSPGSNLYVAGAP